MASTRRANTRIRQRRQRVRVKAAAADLLLEARHARALATTGASLTGKAPLRLPTPARCPWYGQRARRAVCLVTRGAQALAALLLIVGVLELVRAFCTDSPLDVTTLLFATAPIIVSLPGGFLSDDGNPYTHNAEGNGTDDDRQAFVKADEALGRVSVSPGVYLIGTNLTIASFVSAEAGAMFKPAAGVNIHFAGGFEGQLVQYFDYSSGGTVTFAAGPVEQVFPHWFAAAGDGVTDDRLAIQRASTARAAAGGGLVGFPTSTYAIGSGEVSVDSNVTWAGVGAGASIIKRTGATDNMIRVLGTLATPKTNITFRDLTVDGNKPDNVYTQPWNGIFATYVEEVRFLNVEFKNCRNDGLVVEYSRDISISFCTSRDHAKAALYASGCDRVRLIGNSCRNNGTVGIVLALSWYCVVSGNICSGHVETGMYCGRDSRYNVISDNELDGFYGLAEAPAAGSPYDATRTGHGTYNGVTNWGMYYCKVTDNIIWKTASAPGVFLVGSDDNVVENNDVTRCPNFGIAINSGRRNTVKGNRVFNNGNVAGNRHGIALNNVGGSYPNCADNFIEDNTLWDDTFTDAQLGINVASSITGTVVRRNDVRIPYEPYILNSSCSPVPATKTGAYTISRYDELVRCDAGGGAFTVTLPEPARVYGYVIAVKRLNAGANNVTVATTAGNIDGAATRTLTTQYQTERYRSDGTDWWVV